MQKQVNKEFLISFDIKPVSSPDTDNEELASDSNQLTFQNKFQGLEKRARKFEAAVLNVFEAVFKTTFSKAQVKRSFGFTSEPRPLPLSLSSPSLVKTGMCSCLELLLILQLENVTLISLLVNFYIKHLNGVGLIICETMLKSQLDKDPFGSLLVLTSCTMAYPVVMNLLSRPQFSPKHNPFYLRLKIKLSNSFETPSYVTLTALTACCLLELGYGDSVLVSLSIALRLMSLCGIDEDVSIEDLFSRNLVSLTHSFLWNFWENCKLLDAPNQKPQDNVYFRFAAQTFEQMHQIPSTEMHIFNQQLFRQITFLQKSLTQPNPDFKEIFSSGFQLFSKIQLAEPTVYEWVSYLSNRGSKTLQDKMFLAKAGNAVTFLSLHILLLNLMHQIPKSPHDSKELSTLSSILDICEKTLSVLSTIEKRGQQIFSKNDPHLINSICINLSIPYYYMALACLQDYSPRGYLVFYACLEKLRNLSSCWNVVSGWVLIIVERRKNDLPLTTPPLALDSK